MLSFLLATTKTMLVLTPASNAVSAFGLPIIQQYSASGMITIGKVPRFIDSRLLATSSNRDEELRAPNIELLHDDFSEFLDKKNLRLALKDSPLFDGLSNVDIERIVQVSDVVEVSTGEDLFHEGEEGDSLYVVRSGRFEAYRKADDEKGENAKCLMVYEKGDVLGELSMLFDKSRSAAVRSTGNDQLCNLWKIKKDDYVAVLESSKMKDSVMTSIQQDPLYSGYMEDQQMRYSVLRCPLFKGLEKDDLERVLRCFVKKSMKDGQNIITQGDEGDAMYFVQSGECICVNAKTGDVLATVTEGGYFGELALLFSQKRAASVTATGDNCVVWKISKDDFLETVQESPLYDKSLSLLKTKYQSNTLWGIIKRCTFGELYSLAKTSNRPKKKNVSYHSIVSTMTTAVFASAL
jgi:CRP-like cAMP-binding protein